MDILAQVNENETEIIGELQEGFLSASVKNIGSVAAMVNGVELMPGEAKGYPFVGKGYKKIPYNPKGGKLRVMFII